MSEDPSTEFVGHMLKNQHAVRSYLFSLHPQAQDLDDLMQQTAMTLWREFERYDRSREFLPWAIRIAYFEVLRLRKKQSRDRLVFTDGLLEILAEDAISDHTAKPVLEAIHTCLARLDDSSREVLLAHYGKNQTVSGIAALRKVSVHRLYRLLDSARCAVTACVRRHLYLGDEEPSL